MAGLGLTIATVLFGIGSVFASSGRMGSYWRNGSLKWMEWACLTGTGVGSHYLGLFASTQLLGDAEKVKNHWAAYGFVKSCNRWDGRYILGKKPTY